MKLKFAMETEEVLLARILMVTVQIREHYPELYRNLNEMYATLPVTGSNVINPSSLNRWLESLYALKSRYDTVRHS